MSLNELDLLAAEAWPAREQVELEGWLLRASAGVTLRANSALPLVATPVPLDALLAAVEDFYDARLLPPVVQVSDPDLDAALDARGWAPSPPVDLLAGPLPDGASTATVGALDDDWLDLWWGVDGRYGPAEQEVARWMLEAVEAPSGYARAVRDGELVGVARGVAQGPWLGVPSVAVAPQARRRGVGRDLLRALRAWGEEQGAWSAYLQVAAGSPARGLYTGMRPVGSYRYRTRPRP